MRSSCCPPFSSPKALRRVARPSAFIYAQARALLVSHWEGASHSEARHGRSEEARGQRVHRLCRDYAPVCPLGAGEAGSIVAACDLYRFGLPTVYQAIFWLSKQGSTAGLCWPSRRSPHWDPKADSARMGSRENRHVGSRRAPCKGGAFQWVKAPPGQLAPAGSNRSSHGDAMGRAANRVGIVANKATTRLPHGEQLRHPQVLRSL